MRDSATFADGAAPDGADTPTGSLPDGSMAPLDGDQAQQPSMASAPARDATMTQPPSLAQTDHATDTALLRPTMTAAQAAL